MIMHNNRNWHRMLIARFLSFMEQMMLKFQLQIHNHYLDML